MVDDNDNIDNTTEAEAAKPKRGRKRVTAAKSAKGKVTLTLEPAKGGDKEELVADSVLVAIGRKPYTEGLGLDVAGVVLDEKGRIKTDHHFQTNVPGIYMAGSIVAGRFTSGIFIENGRFDGDKIFRC